MFPGVGARVDYNEAGEPTGWDYPSYDKPDDLYDDHDYYDYYDDEPDSDGETDD